MAGWLPGAYCRPPTSRGAGVTRLVSQVVVMRPARGPHLASRTPIGESGQRGHILQQYRRPRRTSTATKPIGEEYG